MFGWNSGKVSVQFPGSIGGSPVGFGGSPKRTLDSGVEGKSGIARVQSLAASRLCSPEFWCIAVLLASLAICRAQDAVTPPEAAEIVVSATRLPTPEDETPASVSVLTDEDFADRQTDRVGDALRAVPGLSVVQSGAPGQLTSVFTRGLRSEHTQVLIDGVPINQGLAGLFNFADLTVDDLDRIEVVRGPQSTVYGPRALAGVIQLFTKQGTETPATALSFEGGGYDTFRETLSSAGKIGQFDYSLGGSRLDTDNARPNNQYRLSSGVANLGWAPNDTLRVSISPSKA